MSPENAAHTLFISPWSNASRLTAFQRWQVVRTSVAALLHLAALLTGERLRRRAV